MTNIAISDITLREEGKQGGYSLSFKEKIEVAKTLDKLNVDVIETAPVKNGKTDILYLHSVAPLIKNSILSCPVGFDEASVKEAYEAIKTAKKPRLHVMMPVSTVQMEYICGKKPKAMLEVMETVVKCAKALCDDVEVSLMDATRAEKAFLCQMAQKAIDCGATVITLCDSAGEMLPAEFEEFLSGIFEEVPKMKEVKASVECSNSLSMALACALSCICHGVTQIKTSVISKDYPALSAISRVFREKGDSLGITANINMAVLDKSVSKIKLMGGGGSGNSPFGGAIGISEGEEILLSAESDIKAVKMGVKKLGYDLSDEDMSRVYEEFLQLSKNKKVGSKELDAIVASVAMQVVPTYKLISYVINNGNVISPTAHIVLDKKGEIMQGICIGDGPVDAAFLAIEQITGHHFELDDFQIQSVTEGRSAMGSSIVKLRHNGKPYSGKGISTDIIGASINAYINALNKICFEEDEK